MANGKERLEPLLNYTNVDVLVFREDVQYTVALATPVCRECEKKALDRNHDIHLLKMSLDMNRKYGTGPDWFFKAPDEAFEITLIKPMHDILVQEGIVGR